MSFTPLKRRRLLPHFSLPLFAVAAVAASSVVVAARAVPDQRQLENDCFDRSLLFPPIMPNCSTLGEPIDLPPNSDGSVSLDVQCYVVNQRESILYHEQVSTDGGDPIRIPISKHTNNIDDAPPVPIQTFTNGIRPGEVRLADLWEGLAPDSVSGGTVAMSLDCMGSTLTLFYRSSSDVTMQQSAPNTNDNANLACLERQYDDYLDNIYAVGSVDATIFLLGLKRLTAQLYAQEQEPEVGPCVEDSCVYRQVVIHTDVTLMDCQRPPPERPPTVAPQDPNDPVDDEMGLFGYEAPRVIPIGGVPGGGNETDDQYETEGPDPEDDGQPDSPTPAPVEDLVVSRSIEDLSMTLVGVVSNGNAGLSEANVRWLEDSMASYTTEYFRYLRYGGQVDALFANDIVDIQTTFKIVDQSWTESATSALRARQGGRRSQEAVATTRTVHLSYQENVTFTKLLGDFGVQGTLSEADTAGNTTTTTLTVDQIAFAIAIAPFATPEASYRFASYLRSLPPTTANNSTNTSIFGSVTGVSSIEQTPEDDPADESDGSSRSAAAITTMPAMALTTAVVFLTLIGL
jgi:hypothetical protein